MNEYAGINVRLSRTEFERLSATAQRELRHPRDQARYLLRLALGLVDHPHENANRGANQTRGAIMRYSDDDLARIARNPDIEIVDYRQGRQDARLIRHNDMPVRLSEHGLQAEVIRICRERCDLAALIFAIPNGQYRRGQRPEPGLSPGVPDLFLPVARGGHHGMFIELKAASNKPSADQRAWMDVLRGQGYHCIVVWDNPDSVIAEIERYLEGGAQP